MSRDNPHPSPSTHEAPRPSLPRPLTPAGLGRGASASERRRGQERSGRPLWRIALSALVVVFCTRSAAAAAMLYLDGASEVTLLAAYVVQTAIGLTTAVGIWLGRLWAPRSILVFGATIVAVTVYEGFFLGIRPAFVAVSQVLIISLASGALFWFVRRDLESAARERGSSL